MDWLQVSAKTVEDAITEALIQLGITSDQIEYEVIEKGSSGFLGFNAKAAVIRARKKEEIAEEIAEPIEEVFTEPEEIVEETAVEITEVFAEEIPQEKAAETAEYTDPVAEMREFLSKVFAAMDLEVEIDIRKGEEENTYEAELKGKDMGVLIGKRGQTLDSLQYLTNLVVNKHSAHYTKVKLDTENYRERRKATLENLAKNIAYKVKRTKQTVSLEPMNPYERRIIHFALQGDKYVETHSEGEEPYRHVVVTPKR